MKKIIKSIIVIFIVLIAGFYLWYNYRLASKTNNDKTAVFVVKPGDRTAVVASNLAHSGLISSPLAFDIYFYLHHTSTIQAGEYIFEKNSSLKDIITQLERGVGAEKEWSILIREGLTIKEINDYLKTKEYLKDDSFLKLANTKVKNLPAELRSYSFLSLVSPEADLEGYLFPDTYRVYKDFTASDLIKKMLANFQNKVDVNLVNKSGHTLPQIITMASILEKEVRTENDMKIVSGIFWDRIKINQGLQSCATLGYILGVNKPQYSYEDTQIDSLYNTYKYRGLPPGPISNPGLKAIGAALNPAKTDYNFFLSRPDTGETVFSKTLNEHNAAKAKYLK